MIAQVGNYVWVPPSTLLPWAEYMHLMMQVAAEWFAPAGLNRGGIGNSRSKQKEN